MTHQDNQNSAPHAISAPLLAWYQQHHRELPWRSTKDPYRIWLSEVILQQTRVQQGLPYYERFVTAYPTVAALAAAPEQEVLRLWQGLGYYSRARNLHACAKKIVQDYDGHFPQTYEALQKLPGIGKYTAAAIASFAFHQPVPVVDGNVYRVLARLFGEKTDISRPEAFRVFFSLAQELIDTRQPDLFNQAMMEFGALQCTPQKPLCLYCPLQQHCWAFAHGEQAQLPVKNKKTKVRDRYFYYLVVENKQGQLLLNKRPAGDIWEGLFDFYLIESAAPQVATELEDGFLQELLRQEPLRQVPLRQAPLVEVSQEHKHLLSHQRLHVWFIYLKFTKEPANALPLPSALAWFSAQEIADLPKPVLIQNYLKKAGFYVY